MMYKPHFTCFNINVSALLSKKPKKINFEQNSILQLFDIECILENRHVDDEQQQQPGNSIMRGYKAAEALAPSSARDV